MVNNKALGKILQFMFMIANRIYRLKDIIIDVIDKYKTDISYTQAWHAKN